MKDLGKHFMLMDIKENSVMKLANYVQFTPSHTFDEMLPCKLNRREHKSPIGLDNDVDYAYIFEQSAF